MEKLRRDIDSYLGKMGVEYYTVLDYRDLRETRPDIIDREDFVPKSVIIYLLPYYVDAPVNISRYATSLDYHIALSEINKGLCEVIGQHLPSSRLRGYGDHSPIDERHAALIGGLGILGLNGLLINEKYGSYIFIGDMVTDIEPSLLSASAPKPIERCEMCGICATSCPTGILLGKSTLCLSEITQRKGELHPDEIDLMRKFNTVWGCDECQCHCPHNADPKITPVEFFHRERIECLTSDILQGLDKAQLRSRAFGWRGRAIVKRNLDTLGY